LTGDRKIAIANAPVSYGAFELTVGLMPDVPEGDTVLDEVAAAGYEGVDLGPVGYFGTGEEVGRKLSRRRLGLSGGFYELPFSQPDEMPAALRGLGDLLDVFDAVGPGNGFRPKPTLADAGSDMRRLRPGQAARDHRLGLDENGWRRFAEGVEMAVACCRERGYDATLHNETGTYLEAPWEIQKAIETTSIGICLDTGHLLVGGGDPVQGLRDWRGRINHLHIKDAKRAIVDAIVAESAPAEAIWKRQAFCRLGEGDIDLDALLALVRESYAGWIVVEQDRLPDAASQSAADQRANREYLAARGF
jgi:inosose dehydratase